MGARQHTQKDSIRIDEDLILPAERRLQFDREINALLVWVGQADYFVSSSPNEVIVTVLGSCIAVCMYDSVARCGGMNHFILPEDTGGRTELPGMALRYGSYSIERMVNSLLAKGAKRERLVTKVFGGGNVISGNANVGHRNADFVEEYLKREGFHIGAKHLRGNQARKIRFFPTTGKVQMTMLGGEAIKSVVRSEDMLRKAPEIVTKHGSVEIFE
jgi:chemotaxis protein CheD